MDRSVGQSPGFLFVHPSGLSSMLVSKSVGVLQFIDDLQFIFSVVSDSDEEDPEDSEQDIV